MGFLNRDSLEAILRPFKNKIDNLVDKDNASVNNSISINNNGTIATLSSEEKSVKLTIGGNSMELNTDGELKVNGINVMANNSNNDVFEITKKSVPDTYTQNRDIPYSFSYGSAVAIGNDIYLLGNGSDIYNKYNYKYDTTTNTYTQNTAIPYSFSHGSAVAIGTDIYILGDIYNYYNDYKYDTTTDTYTQMADIPYVFKNGSAVAIGTDIYLLGSSDSDYSHKNYKYDTTTDTYTQNRDIPYNFIEGSAVSIGNDIYLLGSSNSNNSDYRKYNYKYDTTTGTYTQNRGIPYEFYDGSAVAIGTNIYLLGGTSITKYNYKYDTTTGTYTQMAGIPYNFRYGSAVAIGTDIYLLGSSSNSDYGKYNYKYSILLNIITIPKKSNYYIYTKSKSYGPEACMVEIVNDEYYTEYINNTIIKSTAPISSNGITKMYIKSGAILNGKEIPCESEGWQDINILNYI